MPKPGLGQCEAASPANPQVNSLIDEAYVYHLISKFLGERDENLKLEGKPFQITSEPTLARDGIPTYNLIVSFKQPGAAIRELTEVEKQDLDETFQVKTSKIHGPRQLYCGYQGCSKSFSKLHQLQSHFRSHMTTRIFKCTYEACHKAFKMKSNLTYHLSTHDKVNVISFPCTVPGCSQQFRQKWILSNHLKNHDNIFRYVCNFKGCDKKYNTRTNFEVHLRKHTGTKPFQCPDCGKTYISKWNMINH